MNKPKVAVIAIHGVGDHKAGATSAQVAAQLQHFHPAEFAAFECTPLQIAVDATALPPPPPPPAPPKRRLPDSVRARALAAVPRSGREYGDIAFTDVTLDKGGDYTASYDTTRLRCGDHFDLFEMFWADLSHGGTKGGLTILRQMMQLLLHVASFGRTALSTLVAAPNLTGKAPGLKAACVAASLGYWLLAVPIALGNLLLLCFGAAFLGLLVSDTAGSGAGVTVAVALGSAAFAAVLLGAVCRGAMRTQVMPSWLERWGVPGTWLLAVAFAALAVARYPTSIPPASTAFGLALAAALVVGTIVARRYEVSRPSVMVWWYTLLVVCALWATFGAAYLGTHGTALNCRQVLALLVEANFYWLVCAWALLTLNNLWLLGAGLFAKLAAGKKDRVVKRAVNTAFVAAAVPASLLLIVVLTLWFLFSYWLTTEKFDVMHQQVALLYFRHAPIETLTVEAFINRLITLSASPAAIPFLLFMAVVFMGLAVAIVPSVLAELFPPKRDNDWQAWVARSLALWRWLNGGFGLLAGAALIAVTAFFILLPGGVWYQYRPDHVAATDLGLTLGVGALAFLSVTRLFGAVSIGKVARTFARLRVVVDTAIDVDNWLRERPEGGTPRLRILARYTSLLRHLLNEGYERIVIVGHSQGTVITADLLRYLKVRNPDLLKALGPIDLLTFGSPLRQLYAARFPALYGWIDNAPHTTTTKDAGVETWMNGYGSGDYVGRDLWPASPASQPGRMQGKTEFCTGALAHTHYFDEHSPDVAAAIRDTIAYAIRWCDQQAQAAACTCGDLPCQCERKTA